MLNRGYYPVLKDDLVFFQKSENERFFSRSLLPRSATSPNRNVRLEKSKKENFVCLPAIPRGASNPYRNFREVGTLQTFTAIANKIKNIIIPHKHSHVFVVASEEQVPNLEPNPKNPRAANVHIWDPISGNLRTWENQGSAITQIASSAHQIALALDNGTIKILDIKNDAPEKTLQHLHDREVCCLKWGYISSIGEVLISGSVDHTIKIWSVTKKGFWWTNDQFECKYTLQGQGRLISLIVHNKSIVSLAHDGVLRTWVIGDVGFEGPFKSARAVLQKPTMKEEKELERYSLLVDIDHFFHVSSHLNNDFRIQSSSGTSFIGHASRISIIIQISLTIYAAQDDNADNQPTVFDKGYLDYVDKACKFYSFASGDDDGVIMIWKYGNDLPLRKIKAHNSRVNAMIQLRDGTLVSGSDDHTIKLWDKNDCICTLNHGDRIRSLHQLSCGTLVSIGWDKGEVKLWEITCFASVTHSKDRVEICREDKDEETTSKILPPSEAVILSEVLHQLSELPSPIDASQELRELDKQEQEFPAKFAQNKTKIAQLRECAVSSNDISRQIAILEAKQEMLSADYTIKAQRKEAVKAFQNSPNQWGHYRHVYIRLEQLFIGCKAVSSEFIKTDMIGGLFIAAKAVTWVGKLLSLIPMIGNSLETVVSCTSGLLEAIDHQRQTNILNNMAHLGTLSDIKKAAESTARQLTEMYRDQLERLPVEKNEGLIDKANAALLKARSSTPVEQIADFAVSQILGSLLDGVIVEGKPLDAQFIECIYTPPYVANKFRLAILSILGKGSLKTTSNEEWKLAHVYIKPGIRTHQGKCFGGKGTQPELYGYRYGTEEEANRLGLELSSQERAISYQETSSVSIRNNNNIPTTNNNCTPVDLNDRFKTTQPQFFPKPENTNQVEELKQRVQQLEEELRIRVEKEQKRDETIKVMQMRIAHLIPFEDDEHSYEAASGQQMQISAQIVTKTSTPSLNSSSSGPQASVLEQRLCVVEQTLAVVTDRVSEK